MPKEKLAQGWVRAIGPGKKNEDGNVIPTELLVGDHVLFGEHTGQKVKHEGKEYLMMREPDVIGVLND